MDKHIVVIGGGPAGIEVAGQLSETGFSVSVVEKENRTGGHLNDWYKLFPDRRNSSEVLDYLEKKLMLKKISIHTGTYIEEFKKTKNGFSLLTHDGKEIKCDAVVLATGFDLFKCERKEEYGYGIYDNVITSADLEGMFRNGKIRRSDGKEPKTIGFVHCVGSRDEKAGNIYCSKLCCVTAVKQAIEVREELPQSKVFCFYMDMRMGGAHYEELYREAQEKWNINFIRGKVSEASEKIDGRLVVKVEDTLAGRPLKIELDMLVLMAGMEMSEGGSKIAGLAGLVRGENKFFAPSDHHYANNRSNLKGVFYAGTCTAPMNITETISHARAAATEVINYLRIRTS
ncbi:MAG: FAD-dependent oxidoreductase [Bacteroidota bacterium]|nr:FAD-dependent oxidoreductase [Bacteroidota bacterium]